MVAFTYAMLAPPAVYSPFFEAINDFGQLAGLYTAPNQTEGFVRTFGHDATFTLPASITLSGAPFSLQHDADFIFRSINNLDGMLGLINVYDLVIPFTVQFNPLTGQFGNFQTVSVPFDGKPNAQGFNDKGEIVGDSFFEAGPTIDIAWLDRNGQFTTIEYPAPQLYTWVSAINDAGTIVGWYGDLANQLHAFVDRNDSFSSIDIPGGSSVQPVAINNLGEVAGDVVEPGDTMTGFVDIDGKISTVQVPGATFTAVAGLNDLGQVLGYSSVGNGPYTPFLATPVHDLK